MTQVAPRQAFPDQLRGIALLGIILVNVPFMAISGQSYTDDSVATGLDRTVAFLVTMFVAAKSYILFSFLFGYSALFILKDGSKINRRVYRRRLIALLLLGLAHAVFFFLGDILVTYALLGFALLLLVKRSDRAVWLTALIVFVVAAFWILALSVLTAAVTLLDPEAVAAGELALFDGYDAAMANGTFWQAALERLQLYPIIASQVIFGQGSLAFVAFCLGMLAARHRFLGRLEEFRPWLRRCAVWGLAIGLPLQFACTWLILGPGLPVGLAAEPQSLIATSVLLILAPILSVGYIGALALLSLRVPRLLAPFARPGQASLTIYLGESVLLCVIFCGWGFGLFGTLGAAAVTGIAIACWLILAIAMSLWLRRFSQGPLEWLVGRWTKGPLRREATAPAA